MKRFCNDNEYDTEAIEDDINVSDMTSSNVSSYCQSQTCIDVIQQCIKNLKCMFFLYTFDIYI